jgi:hypothetical protein
MDEMNTAPEPVEAPEVSNPIDTDLDTKSSGSGKVLAEEPRKPESLRESLEAAAKEVKEEDKPKEKEVKAEEPKPEKIDKPEVKKDQPEKAEVEAAPDAEKKPRGPETREIIEAPSRLLPRSKELWRNVPHELRSDIIRLEREVETERQTYREAAQFHDELREYRDLGKQHNVSVKQALDNYVNMEKVLHSDPATGFKQVLSNLNMQPARAIGHIMQAFGVSPQQLVQHLQQAPHEYTALARQQTPQPQQPQQPVEDPRVKALEDQMNAMRAEAVSTQIVAPFAQEFPEYYENEAKIAQILKSGIIEQIHGSGLSPRDKLEVALGMVAPHALSKTVRQPVQNSNEHTQPVGDLRGEKSIKSSVGAVTDAAQPEKKMSMREMLEDEARKIARRA